MKGIYTIAEVMKEIVSLETNLIEAKTSADVALKDKAQAQAECKEIQAELVNAKGKLKQILSDIDQALVDSKQRLSKLQVDAEAEIKRKAANAEMLVQNINTDRRRQEELHVQKMEQFEEEEQNKRDEIELITTELAALRKRIEQWQQ